MTDQDWLAERFDEHRTHLRAVGYRMLGSVDEADDAVQEAWLRLSRADASQVENLGAWLTTVVARICLNTLRSRAARREEPIDFQLPDPIVSSPDGAGPEDEALIADSVGLAMLVVLDTLSPAERLAFVLHDVFEVPFEDIAGILDRSEPAVRQLASRARRRVRAAPTPDTDLAGQWELVDAFLSAARDGDFEALLAVLDDDVLRRVDAGEAAGAGPAILRGARAVATQAFAVASRGLTARRVLVNGAPGAISFAGEMPFAVLAFTVARGRIVELDILTDPARLRRLDLRRATERGPGPAR